MPTRVTYKVSISPVANPQLRLPVSTLSIRESLSRGWTGVAEFHTPVDANASHVGEAFGWLSTAGILPGVAVSIQITPQVNEVTEGDDDDAVDGAMPSIRRYWPSMVQNISVSPQPLPDQPGASLFEIEFMDVMSYLAPKPIWGVFVDQSLGEILGGVLTLAAGGSGEPTTMPVLPDLLTAQIFQALRSDIERIPYAIATGELCQDWIEHLFGQLGVRYEMVGDETGRIAIRLKDLASTGNPLVMQLIESGSIDHAHTILGAMRILPEPTERGALLDNPTTGDFRRLGLETGSLATVVNSAQTMPEEAERRSRFSTERADLQGAQIICHSAQTAMIPGRLLSLVDAGGDNKGALWQILTVAHAFENDVYDNRSVIVDGQEAYRAPVPISPGRSIIVSAAIDDGEAGDGQAVSRDRLNRVPVRFSFAQQPEANNPPTLTNPPRVMLPGLEQMAGESHGFFASHRQGDICRVAVRNPLFAEIIGFEYRDHSRVSQDFVDSSAGMVIQHGDTEWSGLLFRANSLVDEEGEPIPPEETTETPSD